MGADESLRGDPGLREPLLTWLGAELAAYGLSPQVIGAGSAALLRVVHPGNRRTRFVACVPAPQKESWAYVWSGGWVMVTDPKAVPVIMEAMSA